MSKKINFLSEHGKTISKRKRMSGTDPSKKPEVKQCNVIEGESQNFSAISLIPIVIGTGGVKATNVMGPYRLHLLQYPAAGNEAYERIGNSFFLKSLRLKGYVALSSRIFRPINWRLYLYRFDGPSPWEEDDETSVTLSTSHYLSLFKNVQGFTTDLAANTARVNSRHTFYKAVRKLPKDYAYTCKCIASGTIPVTNKLGNISYSTLGSSGATVGLISPLDVVANEDLGCMSLDVNIKLNDRITYVQANNSYTPTGWTPTVRYYLAYEDDFGVGYHISQASAGTAVNNTYSLSNLPAEKPFSIEFWGRWYYTDD